MTTSRESPSRALFAAAGDPAAGQHRPQALIFSFMGSLALDLSDQPISSAVFLRLLADLDVAEPAARATLSRMCRNGLLDRHQQGRQAAYTLTPFFDQLLRGNRDRVEAADPFEHPVDAWTLLSYSMPESRRDLRHRIRATLTWAGFGGLRDGLWIAPGTVDVNRVFMDAHLEDAIDLADWFAARPLPGTDVRAMVQRAWPIAEIEGEHRFFTQRWASPPTGLDAVAQVTLMGADWLRVLRADPGLPAVHLPSDWPAAHSAAMHEQLFVRLMPEARRLLEQRLTNHR